jgi:hypothetical protein
MNENPYLPPQANLTHNPLADTEDSKPKAAQPERQYDIDGIRTTRIIMILSYIATAVCSAFFDLQAVKGPGLNETLLGISAIVMLISTTVLAVKVFGKFHFAVLFLALAFIPIVSFISSLYLAVKSQAIINHARRQQLRRRH